MRNISDPSRLIPFSGESHAHCHAQALNVSAHSQGVRFGSLLIAMALCCGMLLAKTLEVKVMEIESRLIEPTLTPAFSADRDKFDEIVGKLSAIGPDRGVHHLANLRVDSQPGLLNASARDVKLQSLPERHRSFTVGPYLTWKLQEDKRELSVQMPATLEMAPLYRFELVHAADGKWSLSAVVRGTRGVVMVFERVVGRPVDGDAATREWLAASLMTSRPGSIDSKDPWRMVLDTKSPGASIVRVQAAREGGNAGKASADFCRYSDVTDSYNKSVVTFTSGLGRGAMAGSLVIFCNFEFPLDRRAGKVIRWKGEDQIEISPKTMIADGKVKATEWHDAKKENGYSATPQDPKNAPDCYVRGMIFRGR